MSRPRGLPFAWRLYGLPPWQYRDDVALLVTYEARAKAVREAVPPPLEPLPGNVVTMCFFLCPDVSGLGPHDFTFPAIPVKAGGLVAQWVPYLYTSTEASLTAYREVQGWPTVLGQTEVTQAGGRVRARLLRDGREVVRASATVGGKRIAKLDFLPVILYKELPSMDGRGTDAAHFLATTSRLTKIDFRAGTGALAFPQPAADPIARLAPRKVLAVHYGTLDDFYPETIERLAL